MNDEVILYVCFKEVVEKDVNWHVVKWGERVESNDNFIITEDHNGDDPGISSQLVA